MSLQKKTLILINKHKGKNNPLHIELVNLVEQTQNELELTINN